MRGGGKATKGAKAGGKKMTLAQIRKMLPPNYKLVKKTA